VATGQTEGKRTGRKENLRGKGGAQGKHVQTGGCSGGEVREGGGGGREQQRDHSWEMEKGGDNVGKRKTRPNI